MHLPLRILACLVSIALPTAAAARRLVEPGDALVGTGAAIHVVRGDGLGVEPFTPRDGSGANRIASGGGVVVEPESGRVFATSNPIQGARIVIVDPDSGVQTNVTLPGGELPDLEEVASGIDVLSGGGMLVAVWGQESVPAPIDTANVSFVGPPSVDGVAAASYVGALVADPVVHYGLAATQTEAGAVPQILVAPIGAGEELLSMSWTTGGSTPVTGTPVQAEAVIHDLDFRCVEGPILTTCTRYWVEARFDGNGDCVPSDAALFSYNPIADLDTLFVGPPLRCPVAIERAPDGSLLVLDGAAGPSADTAFVDLRLYRFTHQGGGVWASALLADESDLPDSGPLPPALAVSTVALPEPGAAGAALATLFGVAWAARGSGARRARRA